MRFILGLALVCALAIPAVASAGNQVWGCFDRQADGQCIVRVSIAGSFADIDKQVIREVLADFSLSPNIEVVEDKPADVSVRQGCTQGHICGFFTDMRTRTVYIVKGWSYANYCCNSHDGMRGVYCHELMHAIGGISDSFVRLQPSCFNGTSPFLGIEDFADIAFNYPLG